MRDPLILPAQKDHRYSVIWLHGLGADGNDFAPLIPQLNLSDHTRFILPHAPVRPITLNGGFAMPGWYDIVSLDRTAPQDETGIVQSAEIVRALIAQEQQQGIAADHIFLVGFSQGGAMALFTGVTHPERLAGILGLSTYLPIAEKAAELRTDANQLTPIAMVHGTQDDIVPYAFGKKSHMALREWGYDAQWQDYPMAHEVCQPEIAFIAEWLRRHGAA